MSDVRWYMMRGGEAVPIDREAVVLNCGGSRAARRRVETIEKRFRDECYGRPLEVRCRGMRYQVRHA